MIHNDLQETNCENIAKLEAITFRELNHEADSESRYAFVTVSAA